MESFGACGGEKFSILHSQMLASLQFSFIYVNPAAAFMDDGSNKQGSSSARHNNTT